MKSATELNKLGSGVTKMLDHYKLNKRKKGSAEMLKAGMKMEHAEFGIGRIMGYTRSRYLIIAFNNGRDVKRFLYPECLNFLKVVENDATFEIDGSVLVSFRGTDSEVEIPNNVTTIGKHCFEKCSFLEYVIIHDNVTSIDDYAFCGCLKLTKITIPQTLQHIGKRAFQGTSIRELVLPDSVRKIENGAFKNCERLENIHIPNHIFEINYETFDGCINLKKVTGMQNVRVIGNEAFHNCVLLQKISFPINLTEICRKAFDGCLYISRELVSDAVKIDPIAFGYQTRQIMEPINTGSVENEKVNRANKHIQDQCIPLIDDSAYVKSDFANKQRDHVDNVFHRIPPISIVILAIIIASVLFVIPSLEMGYMQNTAKLTFDEERVALVIGDIQHLQYELSNHVVMSQIAFKSSDPDIVTVDNSGYVRVLGSGESVIRAFMGTRELDSVVIAATAIGTDSIVIQNDNFSMDINSRISTSSLTYTIYPENASNKKVYFESENPAMIEILEDFIFSKAEGECDIYICQDGVRYDSVTITSKEVPVEKVVCNESQIYVGQVKNLNIEFEPENATYKDVVLSTSNENVVSVNGDSIVGNKEGSATITITSKNGLTTKNRITVIPVNPTLIEISSSDRLSLNKGLHVGDTLALTTTVIPLNTTYKQISWKTNNPSIVLIDKNGNLTAKKVGNATIIATHKTGLTQSFDVKVLPIEAVSITITEDVTEVYEGQSVQLSAQITPENVTNKTIEWSSSDPSVLAVSASGKITAKSGGTANIIATTNNGISVYKTITVIPTSKYMKVRISANCISNNHVGNDWWYSYKVNGNLVNSGDIIPIKVNSKLSVSSMIVENDSVPDEGKASYSLTVNQDYWECGFYIEQTIYVTENRGRYTGNSATWYVRYEFEPI